MNIENIPHGSLLLTGTSFVVSVSSFLQANMNASNIAWAIGCGAGIVSICAGIMTIREKRLKIRKLKQSDFGVRQAQSDTDKTCKDGTCKND